MSEEKRLDRLTSILKRRGFILPSFEIYGGISGLIDYGPVGARIKRKVTDFWIDHWINQGNIVEIDSPTITPEQVLIASGHVGEFNDLMTSCVNCNSTYRADHLIANIHDEPETVEISEMNKLLKNKSIICINCHKSEWTSAKPMNLMFKTGIGAMKNQRVAYMRPETAQGMFMLFPSLYRHFRQKLPFGAIQVGKGYRNEISPRQGMIRLREFNMAELEYFIDPENPPLEDLSSNNSLINFIPDPESGFDSEYNISFQKAYEMGLVKHPTVASILMKTWDFLAEIGINTKKVRFRQHVSTEMAHYASDCWDCEIFGEYGWVECVGIANRTCHDLESHEKNSGSKSMKAWRSFEEPHFESKRVISPKTSIIGPKFKQQSGSVIEALKNLEVDDNWPKEVELGNGKTVTITSNMVEIKEIETTISGEWFTPHVIEPAFGIDRIIWHLLDHSYEELMKEGEDYTMMKFNDKVSPIDAIILPLFEKDGMDKIASEITNIANSIPGVRVEMDTSKSIGRRYARADEIGVPWTITVDHISKEDNTVTVRRRDDQLQIRVSIEDIFQNLTNKSIEKMFLE